MDHPHRLARLLCYRPYRLIVLGLVVVAMTLPLNRGEKSSWEDSGDTSATYTTLSTRVLAPRASTRR